VLDYNSLFILFSFVVGRGGAALDYVPRGWVGESHVMHVAHLLDLQVYTGSFETSQQGEMACCFSPGKYFLGLGSA
jgi:hypothetical protein